MEFRTQTGAAVAANPILSRARKQAFFLFLAPALFAQPEFRYQVRHDHWLKSGDGTLIISEKGVAFQETGKKRSHAWTWAFREIQQLEIAPRRLRVLTYEDDKWKLGADRELRFDVLGDGDFTSAYDFLRDRLDQRLVAALADKGVKPLWEIPAKHLTRFGGSQGLLVFGEDRVVYRTDRGDSRTWRYSDIENITSAGPYRLTITTYERALAHYGDRKDFNFQLKERLDEDRYNQLWRRIHRPRGIELLSHHQERTDNQ